MNRSFSIIIVTWNALEHLKTFLPSVSSASHPDFEIIIANNASADGSAEWVQENFPEINVVTFSKNHGYCGGNNRAADYAEGEILVFLNNDVKTDPDWLNNLEKAFDDENVAAVQPKMRSYDSPEFFEYAGAAGGFLDYFGYPFCRGRIFDTIEKDHGQYDKQGEIFWASGAALAIRKDLFLESGRFDEDFEFHMEEIDLCWRLWNRGYRVLYEPSSVVYHLGGGSMPMGSARKIYFNYRNNLIMLVKNLPAKNFLFRLLGRLILDGVAGIRSLFRFRPDETYTIIRAHFAFYRRLISAFKKRKILLDRRENPEDPPVLFKGNILAHYFIYRKKYFSELNIRE